MVRSWAGQVLVLRIGVESHGSISDSVPLATDEVEALIKGTAEDVDAFEGS
jgi:hypothetical protein